MINTYVGDIPLKIQSSFWQGTCLFAYIISQGGVLNFFSLLLTISSSVFIHELGHAIAAILYGYKPTIQLSFRGGKTTYLGEQQPSFKQFAITLAGPLFGFGLFLIATTAIKLGFIQPFFMQLRFINLILTFINLLPILPLDGGHLLRIVLQKISPNRGNTLAHLCGLILTSILSILFYILQNLLMGSLLFFITCKNYTQYRETRGLMRDDYNDRLNLTFQHAQKQLFLGNHSDSLNLFKEIRTQTQKGSRLYLLASIYIAKISYGLGHMDDALSLLQPLQNLLDSDSKLLLHTIAYESKKDALVTSLSGEVYRYKPSKEIALRNAYSAARTNAAKSAVGWLSAVCEHEIENLEAILQTADFDIIRSSNEFQQFTKKHNLIIENF
jgi:stage IV sporulation protein FB